MKPLVYSLKRETQDNSEERGWFRGGHDIAYFQNGLKKDKTKKSLSTLTFSFTFSYDEDVVYFAYSYPYTYSNLLDTLYSIEADPLKSKFCKRAALCQTIAGNPCDLLIITNSNSKL